MKRGVEASLVTAMGRFAAHTGQEITFDEMLNMEQDLAPGIDNFTMTSPAPLLANADASTRSRCRVEDEDRVLTWHGRPARDDFGRDAQATTTINAKSPRCKPRGFFVGMYF